MDEHLGRAPGTGRALIRFVTDRPGHDWRYAIDPSKIERTLNWTPAHTFETGLRETVAWYLNHGTWLEATADQSYLDYYDAQYGDR